MTEFLVKVIVNTLNIRNGPGASYTKLGEITDKGVYTIIETNSDESWGKLKDTDNSWICITSTYVRRLSISGNYDDGVFRRNVNNNGWINFNDNNEIYKRNSDNSAWVGGDAKSGNTTIYRRNTDNNGWIQIYPAGVVENTSQEIVVEGDTKMANYRKDYGNWRQSYARQGWAIVRNANGPAGGIQFGMIACKHTDITGHGDIVDPGKPRFGGQTGGSGNYNTKQTIRFRGSTHKTLNSGNPLGTHDKTGYFGFTWKSSGFRSPIPEDYLDLDNHNGREAFLRWVNNTGGYGVNMCIYNGETDGTGSASSEYSANYLTIEKFRMTVLGYKYSAQRVLLTNYTPARTMVAMSMPRMVSNTYLDIVVPATNSNLSVDEIIDGVENGTLDYTESSNMMSYSDFNYKPVILQYDDNIVTTSPLYDDYDKVQYKYEEKWYDAIILSPRTFSILYGSTKIRIINELTEEVYFEMLAD